MPAPFSITAADLAACDFRALPQELVSARHLVYSSPATLAFNSPGAQGFGVKRAGLAIPGSVMLLVAPACCGRNTAALGHEADLADRFFYLKQDDTDIVTGRHLSRIPEAVCEAVQSCRTRPSAVMICITCVDALLGTDMERVCRKAAEAAGLPVVPCYMYALTREGRLPPMVAVRQAVYSLLPQRPKNPRAANLLGFFSPVDPKSDLFTMLRQLGLRQIREISRCRDFAEYESMAEANFNLVLHPDARHAADGLQQRLGIPAVEIRRLHQPDRIQRQYDILAQTLGGHCDLHSEREAAEAAIADFRSRARGAAFAVGEWCNADPLELALSLLRLGFRVPEIFATIGEASRPYIRRIAELSPDTRIYSNLSPTMLFYDEAHAPAPDFTIGRDAAYYHPATPSIPWADEIQPFGFQAVAELFTQLARLA